jgi:DNA-directed RNA polymerase specialized sigma subunit
LAFADDAPLTLPAGVPRVCVCAQGLLYSLVKFDPSKGFKLSTYATWWIRQYVQKAVRSQGDLIK